MPITKTAQDFLVSKEAAVQNLPQYAASLFRKGIKVVKPPINLGKKSVSGVYRATKSVASPVANTAYRGVVATGKSVYHRPKATLGVLSAGTYVAATAPSNLKANLSHVDPSKHYTTAGVPSTTPPIIGQITSPFPTKSIQFTGPKPTGYNLY